MGFETRGASRGKTLRDAWFDADHGDASYHTDGDGIFKISGNVPRMYIHDPQLVDQWRDVEVTMYFSASTTTRTRLGRAGCAHAHEPRHHRQRERRTSATRAASTRACATTARSTSRRRRATRTRSPSSSKTQWAGGMPKNVWLGYKLAVYDLPNGNVKLEL